MKYFGTMGLNLPMLIANSQHLESWNTVGQYSPPIGGGGGSDRSQLRVPLPMSFSTSQSELSSVANAATRSLFGGSSTSDLTASPHKPMETSDTDEKDDTTKCERTTPSSTKTHEGIDGGGGGGREGDGGGGGTGGVDDRPSGNGAGGTESGSSPIPNTNIHEHPAHTITPRRTDPRDQEDLDIKQELVDYFHAPLPPAPPGSHRSYSSTEVAGGGGGTDSDEFAQDLRISAAAAAKSLDFSHFVLPRNLRRSSDSIDEKYTPLNMRKLNAAAAAAAATATTTAGQMLMSSLLSSTTESMSAEDTIGSGGGRVKSVGSQDMASNNSAATAAAAQAAAAAIYAESLNKDDCDFIGSNVTLKLRSMDRTQRIIAEKLISEVLFFGQFNELERSARIQPK